MDARSGAEVSPEAESGEKAVRESGRAPTIIVFKGFVFPRLKEAGFRIIGLSLISFIQLHVHLFFKRCTFLFTILSIASFSLILITGVYKLPR